MELARGELARGELGIGELSMEWQDYCHGEAGLARRF